jgi:VWFA-related protein
MRKTTFFARSAVAATAFWLFTSSAALAQAPPARQAALLREGVRAAVEVTAMDLDVVATKDGTSVNDLKKEELKVRVDGKEFPLDYFARLDAGTLYGPDLATASPDLILETTQAGEDRYLPRQFLVFFDDEHLLPPDRKRIIEGLRDFVTRLSPSDRMAIVSYNIGSKVLVPFTNSKETLFDGLLKLEKLAPRGLYWESQYRNDVNLARRYSSFSSRGRNSRDAIIRSYGEQIRAREQGTLNEFKRSIAALAARSGKRVLLYVSDGIELHPGQTFSQSLGSNLLNQWDQSVTAEYERAIAKANRSGVTIHSIDARGLTTDVDASENAPPVIDPFLDTTNRREVLAGFAEATGGVLVENRNTFPAALDRIYQASSSYYSIGVTLSNLDPRKKEHAVEVTTTRPGVKIQTRRSWSAKTADDAARDRMEMALMTPDAKGEFAVTLQTGAPTKKDAGIGRRLIPFEVKIPLSELTFLNEGGKKKAVVEVSLAAVEDTGARSDPEPVRQTILLDADALAKKPDAVWVYETKVKSRTGNMRFVATVRDTTTNRIAVASTSIRVE